MEKKVTPPGLTSYQKRLKKYFEKYPYATITEARGHKPKAPRSSAAAIATIIKATNKKASLGVITKSQQKEIIKLSQKLRQNISQGKKLNLWSKEYAELVEKSKKIYEQLEKLEAIGPREKNVVASEIFYH